MAYRRIRPTIREENERALLEAAEIVFAEQGFAGATTAAIARRAGVPKANLHYYFATKEGLYRAVVERVLTAWLAAASSFDTSEDPAEALSAYVGAKMDLAREMPLASRIWSAEIMRGAPIIQDFLDTTLSEWVASREKAVRRWIAAGKLKPIEPKVLFYMIWATTQQYANASHEMATLNDGRPLDDAAFDRAKRQVIETILGGVAARPARADDEGRAPCKIVSVFASRMIDRMMLGELAAHLDVIGRFVCVQRAFAADILHDEGAQCFGVNRCNMLGTNTPATFDKRRNHLLRGRFAIGAVLGLSADNGFVGLDNLAVAAQRAASLVRRFVGHSLADAMSRETMRSCT